MGNKNKELIAMKNVVKVFKAFGKDSYVQVKKEKSFGKLQDKITKIFAQARKPKEVPSMLNRNYAEFLTK